MQCKENLIKYTFFSALQHSICNDYNIIEATQVIEQFLDDSCVIILVIRVTSLPDVIFTCALIIHEVIILVNKE